MDQTRTVLTPQSGDAEAIIIIKAVPHVSKKHGETVCCAAIDVQKNWLRLYPVSFRLLEEARQFGRWDRVRFKWRLPKDDARVESRRVDQDTLTVLGKMPVRERAGFMDSLCVSSLKAERIAGRSLALLRPEILAFRYEKKKPKELQEEKQKFDAFRAQGDMLNAASLVPFEPCPYRFKYDYRDADGEHVGTCQDWETEATFFRWSRDYGEAKALADMESRFGTEYSKKGMVLAMGTHSLRPDQWLINGVVRLDEAHQASLF